MFDFFICQFIWFFTINDHFFMNSLALPVSNIRLFSEYRMQLACFLRTNILAVSYLFAFIYLSMRRMISICFLTSCYHPLILAIPKHLLPHLSILILYISNLVTYSFYTNCTCIVRFLFQFFVSRIHVFLGGYTFNSTIIR